MPPLITLIVVAQKFPAAAQVEEGSPPVSWNENATPLAMQRVNRGATA